MQKSETKISTYLKKKKKKKKIFLLYPKINMSNVCVSFNRQVEIFKLYSYSRRICRISNGNDMLLIGYER